MANVGEGRRNNCASCKRRIGSFKEQIKVSCDDLGSPSSVPRQPKQDLMLLDVGAVRGIEKIAYDLVNLVSAILVFKLLKYLIQWHRIA